VFLLEEATKNDISKRGAGGLLRSQAKKEKWEEDQEMKLERKRTKTTRYPRKMWKSDEAPCIWKEERQGKKRRIWTRRAREGFADRRGI